jgi:hypothetical protein
MRPGTRPPAVGRDRRGRLGVQARIGDEVDGGRIGQPGPQQGVLTVVITKDDRLARGDALFRERHDERAELGVGAVETGFVKVADVATSGAGPRHSSPGWVRPEELKTTQADPWL